jgi:hypothetical protein
MLFIEAEHFGQAEHGLALPVAQLLHESSILLAFKHDLLQQLTTTAFSHYPLLFK